MKRFNVCLVSNAVELHSKLNGLGVFNKVNILTDIKSIPSDCDLLIVSDQLVPFNDFLGQFDSFSSNREHIFYLISTEANNNFTRLSGILKAKNVDCIPPRLTNQQIVEKILELIYGGAVVSKKNIVTFFGADSKVGTTITAQAIAENMAKHSDKNIIYMPMNGNPSVDYFPPLDNQASYGIDNIKGKVISEILTADELQDACMKFDNLHVLPGADAITNTRHYHPEHIEYLIGLASKIYGAVIIDAGCKMGIGMSIGGLNSTHNRYLIVTQQDIARRNFERTYEQIFAELDINIKDFFIIVNKFTNNTSLPSAPDVAGLYKSNLAGTLPILPYGWQAEAERNSLLNYKDYGYNRQIDDLTRAMCSQMGAEYIEKETKKKSFFKLFA